MTTMNDHCKGDCVTMSHKFPPIEEIVEGLVQNKDEKQALVELLEQRGFLSSPYRSYYDHEVRHEIIVRLAEIGDESALPILRRHMGNYGNIPDPEYKMIAEAAHFAIEAIESRLFSEVQPPYGLEMARPCPCAKLKELQCLPQVDVTN